MEASNTLLMLVGVSLVSATTGIKQPRVQGAPTGLHGSIASMSPFSPARFDQSESLCKVLMKDPYFEAEMVVGVPWRVYYTWENDLGNVCVDFNFKIATQSIIRRFYFDMSEYLEEQPAWGAASLLVNLGRSRKELLLFDDQPAGRFDVVPNELRDSKLLPLRSIVPLMKLLLKLLRNGKYLILMDCKIGLVSLAAKKNQPVDRAEIQAIAESYKSVLGDGYNVCVNTTDLKDSDIL